jgi:hypothetical protein
LQVIVLGSAAQMIAFSIQASAPPFPIFVIAYAINGFGASLEDAQANGFVANYKDNASAKMGILHAAYGKGLYSMVLLASTLLYCVRII